MAAPRFDFGAGTKYVLLMVLAGVIATCGTHRSTPAPVQDPVTLIAAVRNAGASLARIASDTPVVDLPAPELFLLDGELIQIGAATLLPAELQALDSAAGNTRIWHGEGWYLAYAGRDGGVILLLSGLLGEPFQAVPVTLEEPFPPAIPRAMRKLADALDRSPSDLTVLDFQAMTWQDACLGIPSPADVCAPGAVTGWTVSLMLDDERYELHSDDAGEIVRWSDFANGAEK